jgi:pyruvate ferredoxin oxidoreductase alpha subunit
MTAPLFLSGNEAVAHGVRLCRPRVIAAYPITPQTIVVERLSEMVDAGELSSDFVHVESEHSALALVMGSAAMGVRTFTATSSQGLMYMAECLTYTSGGRFPLVMMNANRALALPWNIYGDQSDSLALISSGWIQSYAETAQESLDMVIQAYAIAEDVRVRTPVMVNLDGFVLTHTYESVLVPEQEEVDAFLPSPDFPVGYPGTFDLELPQSLAVSAGPGDYTVFKYRQHQDMVNAVEHIHAVGRRFAEAFGRGCADLIERYRSDDAELVIITLGSIAGTVRDVVDELRAEGISAGLLRIRYLRPFPTVELGQALFGAGCKVKALGVLEKDISFGHQGSVSIEVKSALYDQAQQDSSSRQLPLVHNFVAGLGGQDVSRELIKAMFETLAGAAQGNNEHRVSSLHFAGMEAFQ